MKFLRKQHKENLEKVKHTKHTVPGQEVAFWSLESFLLIQRLENVSALPGLLSWMLSITTQNPDSLDFATLTLSF